MKYTSCCYLQGAPLVLYGFSLMYLEPYFEDACVLVIKRQVQCPRVFYRCFTFLYLPFVCHNLLCSLFLFLAALPYIGSCLHLFHQMTIPVVPSLPVLYPLLFSNSSNLSSVLYFLKQRRISTEGFHSILRSATRPEQQACELQGEFHLPLQPWAEAC